MCGDVPVQRCQWHKRENVVSIRAKWDQPTWRRKLQAAYAHPTYEAAQRALEGLRRALQLPNASAAASLEEGLEETLTLHRLGVFPALGASYRTTNLIESVMARQEAKTRRVTRWRTSDQKLRWCASALWAAERQLRRVKGHRHLPLLKQALQATLSVTHSAAAQAASPAVSSALQLDQGQARFVTQRHRPGARGTRQAPGVPVV